MTDNEGSINTITYRYGISHPTPVPVPPIQKHPSSSFCGLACALHMQLCGHAINDSAMVARLLALCSFVALSYTLYTLSG